MAQLNELSPTTALAAVFVIFVVSRILRYVNALKTVSNWPGLRCAFMPFALLGAVLPTKSWNPGAMFTWKQRFSLYQAVGTDTISIVSFLHGRPEFWTSNLDVVRQVVAGGVKSAWIKPADSSYVLATWGMNLFVAERDVWQRHRRIISPAFNNNMYALVWEKAVGFYQDMINDEGWSNKTIIEASPIQKYTSKLAFLAIAVCGFGMETSWSDGSADPTDSTEDEPISETLRIATTLSFAQLAPKWVRKLPTQYLRKLAAAEARIDEYMHKQVAERRALVQSQLAMNEESGRDMFSLLVLANETNVLSAQNRKLTLDESETIGNVFLLLLAGHETTAVTLAATFALLAAHQEIQEDIYEEIMDVVGPDRIPQLEDYHKLDKVLCAFYEAARMYPAVYVMIRETTEDTELVVPTSFGDETKTIVVPKGTRALVDMVGLQYNPRYYHDPEKFIPSRWHGEDKADAVTAFSIGPRNCVGRRFATTEAVAFLTMWLRDWRVEPLLSEDETLDQWCTRVLDARLFLSLGVEDVPIVLKRRVHG